jgi:pimeloyl-ACP methyl ester carboxylesterase
MNDLLFHSWVRILLDFISNNPAVLAACSTPILIFYFFGPFRSLVFRKKPFVTLLREPTEGSTAASIILIHGTYARGSQWTQKSSGFVNELALQFPGSPISCLVWSGDNYHAERIRAAKTAARWLNENYPAIIIGHSHGGTVGQIAAAKVREEIDIKLVTLSTPFVHIQPRRLGFSFRASGEWMKGEFRLEVMKSSYQRAVFERFCYYSIVAMLILITSIIGGELCRPYYPADEWILIFSSAILLVGRFIFGLSSARDIVTLNNRAKKMRDELDVRSPSSQLLVLKVVGDEAAGLIGFFGFVGWIGMVFMRAIERLSLYIRIIESIAWTIIAFMYNNVILLAIFAIIILISTSLFGVNIFPWMAPVVILPFPLLVLLGMGGFSAIVEWFIF